MMFCIFYEVLHIQKYWQVWVIVMLEGEYLSHSKVLSTVEQVYTDDIPVLCSSQISINPDQFPSHCYWKWYWADD